MRRSIPPRILAVVGALLASAPVTASAQGTVTVAVGSSPTTQVVPGGKLAVPVLVDLSAASGGNVASIAASLKWATGRLTLDSIVKAGTFGTLTANTADASNGSAALTLFNATGTSTTTTFATAWFTAASTIGGTQVAVSSLSAGTDAGASLSAALRARPLDVCVVPFGKWGDVNGDSVVNILDAQQISRLAVALPVANGNLMNNSGDVNADGVVNIIDAQQVARSAIGLSTAARTGTPVGIVPAIASVAVTPGTQSMNVGQSLSLSPSVRDSVGTPLAGCVGLTWTSSDPTKATVDSSGTVKALANGTVNITLTAAGRSAQTALTLGSGVSQGIRVTASSPVPVKGYMVWGGAAGIDSSVAYATLTTSARTATIDLPTFAAANFTVRVAAIDSISGDTLRPIVAATGSADGVTVSAGALTALSVALSVPTITIGATSATTIAAGVPAPVSWSITDPSHLFTDQTTSAFCGRIRYRMGTPWTTDDVIPDTIPTVNVASSICPQDATNLSSYDATLPVATGSGRMYWQIEQLIFVPNSAVRPVLYGPRLVAGDTLRSVAVTGAAQGIKVNFTAPVAGTRFVAQIFGGGLPFSIYKKFDTTSVTTGALTIPTPVGTGFSVRLMAVDARDPKGSRVISGVLVSGIDVAAGAITTTTATLATISYNFAASPTEASIADRVNLKWTITDPSQTFGNFNHLVSYSSTAFTTDGDATTVKSAVTSAGSNQWTHSATVPPQLTAGGLYYQVSEGFTAVSGDELIPLRVVEPFLAAGDTLRRIGVKDVTQGISINVTSPVPAARWIVVVDSVTTSVGLPARTSYIRPGNFARSATIKIPLPVGSGYRVRVLVADSASAFPDAQPLLAAGVRISGVNVTAGALTTVNATTTPYSITWPLGPTATVGTNAATTITLVDAGEMFDLRFFTGSTTTSCPFAAYYSTTPFTTDRVQLVGSSCTGASWSGTTMTGTLTFPAPTDTGTVYLQAAASLFTLVGPDGVQLGLTPLVMYGSAQAGPTAPAVRITAQTQALRVTINSPIAAKKFVALLDGGAMTSPLVKVATTTQSTNSTTFDIPAAVGTLYRVRVAVIDPRDPAGLRVVAGGVIDGLAVTAGNLTGLTMPAAAVTVADSTVSTQLVGDAPKFVWLATDPADILNNGGSNCGNLYYSTTGLTKDYGGTAFTCTSQPVVNSTTHTAKYTVQLNGSQIPLSPATYSYQQDISQCFAAAGGSVCLHITAPFLSAGDSPRTMSVVQPNQGIQLNITSPLGANQYFVVVDSGGLGSALNFVRTMPTYARSTSFVLSVPAGSGYRVRVMVADSLNASGASSVQLASGIRLSNVTVAANTVTPLAANATALSSVLTVPASVSVAQAIPATFVLTDPSELFYQANVCPTWNFSMAAFTTDGGGTFHNACKTNTHSVNSVLTATDSLAAPLSAGTLSLQASWSASAATYGTASYTLRYYAPSLLRKESLRTITVNPVTSSIAVSISSTAARRYIAVVDSGGLGSPVIATLDGTSMTSGTISIPVPPGTGYRVRVAATDSIPTFAISTAVSAFATGAASGLTTTASNVTPVNITTFAVNTFRTPAVTAINNTIAAQWVINDQGKFLSEGSHCGTIRTGSTVFTSISTNLSSCVTQTTQSPSTTQWNATVSAQSTVGSIYTSWATNHIFRTTAGDFNMFFFAPAYFRGDAQDSIRVVTPTQIAVNNGNATTATVATAVGTKPSVVVKDANANPVAGVTVTFAVASGGGTITGQTAITNSSGIATVGSWTLGNTAGTNTVTATASGLTGSPVTFTSTGTAGAATQILANTVTSQTAQTGLAVTTPPGVIVKDALNNPVSGVSVTFAITAGGGSLTSGTVSTNASGIATVGSWTLGAAAGTNTMTATASGLSTVTFNASGTAGTAAKLVVKTAAAGAGSGVVFTTQPVIAIADAAGNTITTDNSSVVTMTTSLGFTVGTVTKTVVNGIANFAGAGIAGSVGTATLTFSSGSLTSATSTVSLVAGNAKSLSVTTTAAGAASGAAFTTQAAITVRDSLGNARTQDNGTVVTVALSGGSATLSGTLTATTVNGVATFTNVAISGTAGTTYTLLYTASGLTTASQGITPTAGTATQLVLSTQAAGAVGAGGSFGTQPVVTVKDAAGNVVTSATGSVTMSVSSPATTFGSTSATISSGVATFSGAGISAATGSYTLTFSSAGLTSVTQSIPVAGAATALAITTSAADAKSGSAFTTQPVIRVVDAAGNTVTTSTASVTIASSGDGVINGPTSATAVGGVATFSTTGLTGTAGVGVTLTYSSAGLTSVTQTLTPTYGTATGFQVFTQAAGASPGFDFSAQPVIRIRDSAGNIVANDNTTQITVTVSSGATLTGTATATAVNGIVTFTNLGLTGPSGTYTLSFDSSISLGGTRTQTINLVAPF